MASKTGPLIPITKNSVDSSFYAPRAIIAVLHFTENFVNTLMPQDSSNTVSDDFVKIEPIIVVSEDIMNMSINSDKKGCTHTLTAMLAPGSYNYLGLISPGDWIMGWIVNTKDKRDQLVKNLKSNNPKQSNYFDSGLKFIGQCHTIQEQFKVGSNGVKSVRYNLNATGFNPYQTQVVYSPYLNPGEGTNGSNVLFRNEFFKNVTGGDGFYLEDAQAAFSVQDQLVRLHQTFLGPGPGSNVKSQGNSLRTVQNGFAVPSELASILGLGKSSDAKADTNFSFADLTSALIGVQSFSAHNEGNPEDQVDIGPDFVLKSQHQDFGTYWEPDDSSQNLTGRKILGVTPTIGGSIWSILQNHLNPVLNEMYVCLRPEPKSGHILPTFVARQIPFSLQTNDKLNTTLFTLLPRFVIDEDIIMGYDFSKSEALRTNTVFLTADSVLNQGSQIHQDALNVISGPWRYDINDVTKNGIRIYNSKISDDTFNFEGVDPDLLKNYNSVISDFLQNSHLKYSGNLQTIGIEKPVTVGENLQIADIIFHIENLTHVYSVSGNGLTSFMTSFGLSNGIHDDDSSLTSPLDEFAGIPQTDTSIDDFAKIKGGYAKETTIQELVQQDPKPQVIAVGKGSDIDSSKTGNGNIG